MTPGLRVSYHCLESLPAAANVLAQIHFGVGTGVAVAQAGHLDIAVGLQPLLPDSSNVEIWHASGPVQHGRDGALYYAHDGQSLFAAIEVDEREHGGLSSAADFIYREMRRFQSASPYGHLWRIWNYFDAVNDGAGDLERYRQFCVGRSRGLGNMPHDSYPAASAIGTQQPSRRLQVYWLAAMEACLAVENPRQVSAYRYPAIYGPVSPSFARATIAADGTLLISGTASILGHASQHPGDVIAQLEETLRNLDALMAQASGQRAGVTGTLAPQTCLKIYLRDATQLPQIAAYLHTHRPGTTAIYLGGDICRRELLLEIECVQTTP
jgi:chorismate lyase/3-hydroxybenzoate synthase